MNAWETAAALLSIAYLLLAMREHIGCWYAGFAGNAIYLAVFWQAGLLMDSALQAYYMGIAIYGWWHWRGGAVSTATTTLPIRRWPWSHHITAITAVLLLSLLSGWLLQRYTTAAFPFADSFTTWGAVLCSWMVARKLLENWIYWVVIDSLSVALYLLRDLHITAVLFCAYTLIALFGFRQWLARYRRQSA